MSANNRSMVWRSSCVAISTRTMSGSSSQNASQTPSPRLGRSAALGPCTTDCSGGPIPLSSRPFKDQAPTTSNSDAARDSVHFAVTSLPQNHWYRDRPPQTFLQLGSGDLRKGIVRSRKRQPFHILMMRQAGTIAQRVTALVEADLIDPGPKAGLALEGPMMEEDLHERLLRHVGRVSMVLQHSVRQVVDGLLMARDQLLEGRVVAGRVAVQELVVRRRHPARGHLLYSLRHAISAKVTRENQEKCGTTVGEPIPLVHWVVSPTVFPAAIRL